MNMSGELSFSSEQLLDVLEQASKFFEEDYINPTNGDTLGECLKLEIHMILVEAGRVK